MAKAYRVGGMTCGGCARSVEAAIKTAAPAAKVQVDLPTGTVTVDDVADDALIEKAVGDAGFVYGGMV